MTPVRLEPAALRSRVEHSTTEPLRSHQQFDIRQHDKYENLLHSMKGQTETAFVPTNSQVQMGLRDLRELLEF